MEAPGPRPKLSVWADLIGDLFASAPAHGRGSSSGKEPRSGHSAPRDPGERQQAIQR